MNKKGKIISFILAVTVATSMVSAIPVFADIVSTSKVVSQTVSASHRLAGIDRYATAVAISQKGWSTSDTVILASGEDYADALTSGPLAKKYDAPILLTSKASINAGTIAEMVRLQVKNIIIIGSEGAVSSGVATQLTKAGNFSITRIGGANRYETSTMVAAKLDKPSAVVIVSGQDFPDALSVSSIASKLGYSIILSEKSGLSDSAKKYIATNGIKKAYIVGGQDVLYPAIEKQVIEPVRLAGANRYETNLAVLKAFKGEFSYDNVFIATGNNFADALAGGALASKSGSPMVLVGGGMEANTADYLVSRESLNTKILALGGETIVSNSIVKSAIDDKASIVVAKNYSSAGTYSDGAISGSVIISEAGVNLKNTTISGDLLISSTVGDGNVDLDNVTVKGKIIINGGGSNSVKLHNMHSESVEIDKATGESVRVATDATSSIETVLVSTSGIVDQTLASKIGSVTVNNNSSVVLKGGFDTVQVNGQESTVKVVDGSIATLNVNTTSSNTIVDVDAMSTVTNIAVNNNVSITGAGTIASVTVAKPGVDINLQATSIGTVLLSAEAVGSKVNISSATTVANLNVNAAVKVSGTGTITNANIGANGTTIAITPVVTSVTAGISAVVNGTTKDSTNSTVITSVPVGGEITAPIILVTPPVSGNTSNSDKVVKAVSKDSNNPTIIGPVDGNNVIDGNLTITADEGYFIILKNTIINGNLTINGVEGNGGSVTLQNVKVNGLNGSDGTVNVVDVGNNSLHFDGLTASTVDISDNNGARIVAEDNALNKINTIKLSSDSVTADPTKFEGVFNDITLSVEKASKVQVDGYIDNITILNATATNSDIKIASEGNIGTIDVSNSSKVDISGDKCDAASSIGNITGTVIANDSLENIKSDSIKYKVAVDDVVSIINKIHSEATEINSLFYRRGRDIQNIIEDSQYGFTLSDTYNSYSDTLKMRVANTIRTYMQNNSSFKTKKEIQNAIDKSIRGNLLFSECGKFNGYFESDNPYIYISPSVNVGEDITNRVMNHSALLDTTNFEIQGISNEGDSKEYLEYIDGKINLTKQNTTIKIIYAYVDININSDGYSSNTNLTIIILPQNSLASDENGFVNKMIKVNVGETANMTFNVAYPDYSNQPDTAIEDVSLRFTFVKNVNNLSDYKIVDKTDLAGLKVNYNGVDLGEVDLSKVVTEKENSEIMNRIPVTTYSFYVPLSSFKGFTSCTKLKELSMSEGQIKITYPDVPNSMQGLPVSLGISSNAMNEEGGSQIYSDELQVLVDTGVGARLTTLRGYNVALASVDQETYDSESWTTYQEAVSVNVVTVQNTQAEVDAATVAIKTAQSSLVALPIVASVVSTISVGSEGIVENSSGSRAPVNVIDQNGKTMTSGYTLSYAIEENTIVTIGIDGELTAGAYSETNHTFILTVTATSTTGEVITGTATVTVRANGSSN